MPSFCHESYLSLSAPFPPPLPHPSVFLSPSGIIMQPLSQAGDHRDSEGLLKTLSSWTEYAALFALGLVPALGAIQAELLKDSSHPSGASLSTCDSGADWSPTSNFSATHGFFSCGCV